LQEDILDDTEEMLGSLPLVPHVTARRPQFMIFSALQDFCALPPQSLEPKVAKLLAAAVAARAGASLQARGRGAGAGLPEALIARKGASRSMGQYFSLW
jgi:hypothetical protein